MAWRYDLSVAGLQIRIEADRTLVENQEFAAFLTAPAEADLHVIVRKAQMLPLPPQNPIHADMFCAVGENEAGYLQKFFFDTVDGPYTVATYHPDGKTVWIEYPASGACGELDLQHCFYCLGFEASLLRRNKLCLHAACVDTHLGGILFSGVSGIGKSTQADLWCKYRGARQINGDRPILSHEGQKWFAWGSPYAGSSKCYVNDRCQVAAIVLLKQANTCSLRRLSPGEAFRGVWPGLTVRTWDAVFVNEASDLAMELVSSIPVYQFCCTPEENAVKYLEEELRKDNCL